MYSYLVQLISHILFCVIFSYEKHFLLPATAALVPVAGLRAFYYTPARPAKDPGRANKKKKTTT